MEMKKRRLLNVSQVADILQVHPGTLANFRHKRKGPPYIKVGGRVLYDRLDVIEYIKRNKVHPELRQD